MNIAQKNFSLDKKVSFEYSELNFFLCLYDLKGGDLQSMEEDFSAMPL
jgi:hypothetical protein